MSVNNPLNKASFKKARDITGKFTITAPHSSTLAVPISLVGATVRMIGKLEYDDNDSVSVFNLVPGSGLTQTITPEAGDVPGKIDVVFVIPASATAAIPDPADNNKQVVAIVTGEISVLYSGASYSVPVGGGDFRFSVVRRVQTTFA